MSHHSGFIILYFLLSWCTSQDPQYPTYVVLNFRSPFVKTRWASAYIQEGIFLLSETLSNLWIIFFSHRTFVRSSHFVTPSFLHPYSILSQVDYAGSPCSSSPGGGVGGNGNFNMVTETSGTMFVQQQQHHGQNSGINSQPQQVSKLAPIDLDGCTTRTATLHPHSLPTDQEAEGAPKLRAFISTWIGHEQMQHLVTLSLKIQTKQTPVTSPQLQFQGDLQRYCAILPFSLWATS